MFDQTHLHTTGADYCTTCGQLIAPPRAYGRADQRSKQIGIAVSILLHLLAVVYYLTRPAAVHVMTPPAREGEMVYIKPLARIPRPRARPVPQVTPPRTSVTRAITPKPKQEVYVPPVVARVAPPVEDMSAAIDAKRRQRAAAQPQESVAPQESEAERANRVARANIAGAQGGATGKKNDSGGMFSIVNQTVQSADINFRGWNGDFKRTWSQQVHVELTSERDIETAIVKKMIALIRKEKPGDFVWESRRLGRNVPMSARVEDTAELTAFLLKEFFPSYRR